MHMKIQTIIVAAGLLANLATVSVFAQKTDKISATTGSKMSHDEMMAKIDKMSTDDKAVMIDKMPTKDKTAAMKTSGQDVSKMSVQEKADMFDKMPMDKKMAMMTGGSMMHKGGKMGKMDKMDK
jgi:hypothetical protein